MATIVTAFCFAYCLYHLTTCRWRVTEISQIILVLLDSRCPLLHYPPSLSTYLSDRKVILVLTKVDISGPARADAWTDYFRSKYPGLRVVQVESYVEKETGIGHQGRKQFEPYLPKTFREKLVDAIREEHSEMLQPPDKVKANPAWLKSWKAPVKRNIDWEAVLNAGGGKVGSVVGGAVAPRPKDTEQAEHEEEPEFLTIGLIGMCLVFYRMSVKLNSYIYRPAECREIIIIERLVWCAQSSSL